MFRSRSVCFSKAEESLRSIGSNYTFIHANFVDLQKELAFYGVDRIDGIIYDLGVSSFQLDIQSRGFSYRMDAPLDMRMNQEQQLTAKIIVNTYPYEELVRIFIGTAKNLLPNRLPGRSNEEERKNRLKQPLNWWM